MRTGSSRRAVLLVLVALALSGSLYLSSAWPSSLAFPAGEGVVTQQALTEQQLQELAEQRARQNEETYRGKAGRWREQIHTRSPCPPNQVNDWYCQPIPELEVQPPPSSVGCPLFDLEGTNPLVHVGVFSSALGGEKDKLKRETWRTLGKSGIPWKYKHLIDVRFILGRSNSSSSEADLDEEQSFYGDLMRLDGLVGGENMDDGKTYGWMRAVWGETKEEEGKRPVFVMKTDLDSFVVFPNVLTDFEAFAPTCHARNASAYWGSHWGSWGDPGVPYYFRGLGYALSYPLLSFIASTPTPLPDRFTNNLEDVRTGHLIHQLPNGASLWLKDESHDAQDWYSAVLRPRSVVNSVVHALKSVEEYLGVVGKVRNAWEAKGWEFEWRPLGREELERGFLLEPLKSVASGNESSLADL